MKQLWQLWQRLLAHEERATTLALFRILVAGVVIASLTSAAVAGVIEAAWLDAARGGMLSLGAGNWLVRLLGGPTPQVVWGLFGVALVSASCSFLGLGGRWLLFATLQAYFGLTSLNPTASGGYDNLICIALWLLCLSRCNTSLSLDTWLAQRRWLSEQHIPAWPRYLLILQLIVVYTATGLQKVNLSWTPLGGYTALYYVLHDPTWLRSEAGLSSVPLALLRLGTAVTWHWEQLTILLLPVFYFRATRGQPGKLRAAFNRWDLRLPWAAVGVALHLGILALIDVGPFSVISLAYYINLFTPEELERWVGKLASARAALTGARSATGPCRSESDRDGSDVRGRAACETHRARSACG
jgi:hypothetical protein